jgi:hypothetical protein
MSDTLAPAALIRLPELRQTDTLSVFLEKLIQMALIGKPELVRDLIDTLVAELQPVFNEP